MHPSLHFSFRLGELLPLGVIALSAILGDDVPINLGISVTAFSAKAFAIVFASSGFMLVAEFLGYVYLQLLKCQSFR